MTCRVTCLLVERIWAEPFDRISTNERWGRILLAVREVIYFCVSAGLCVAFPGYELQRTSSNAADLAREA
eukprot:855723-Pyramimonas_sp.AAC.1